MAAVAERAIGGTGSALGAVAFEPDALKVIRAENALREEILPLRIEVVDHKRTLTVAVENANDAQKQIRCRQLFQGVRVEFVSVPIDQLRDALKRAYPGAAAAQTVIVAPTSPGVRLRERLYDFALDRHGSDIHVEAHKDVRPDGSAAFGGRVKINIDGRLHDVTEVLIRDVYGSESTLSAIPLADYDQLVNSQKAVANMDTDFALPLSGGFSFVKAGRPISLRIEAFLSIHGQNLVMRVNDQSRPPLRVNQLGMSSEMLAEMSEIIDLPAALIYTCGQTESGKNWSNYAFLLEYMARANGQKSVQTIENPVELLIPGTIQNEVNLKAGRTWEVELESCMRRNPKAIYIGETRSAETARVSKDAAQAGQFVLSTLHTTSAPGAIDRLTRGLGLTRDDIASTVTVLLAQRLVRKLCTCAVERPIAEAYADRLKRLGVAGMQTAMVPVGCAACFGSGYSSRTGVFEMIPFSDAFRSLVADPSIPTVRLAAYAREHLGYQPMIYDGLRHVRSGATSLEELFASVAGWRTQRDSALADSVAV